MSAVEEPWHVLAPTSGDGRWTQLAEMVASGDLLLHGSQTPGLTELTPRQPRRFLLILRQERRRRSGSCEPWRGLRTPR